MRTAAADHPAGVRVFDRLAGLETEYAVRFRPDAALPDGAAVAARPPALALFDAIVAELRRAIPVAESAYGKKGYFLANGGAVWHETPRTAPESALFEGATPECRGPRRLLAHQRAQDALLAAAARDTSAGGELSLCKSDRDARGRVYGAQENYELTLAGGGRLLAWRVGLVLIAPTVAVGYSGMIGLALVMVAYFAVAAIAYGALLALSHGLAGRGVGAARRLVQDPRRLERLRVAMFGRGIEQMPVPLDVLAYGLAQVFFAPSALALSALSAALAFRPERKRLLPFLVSRAVVCGSGRVADDGAYHVASKATGLNAVASVNEVFGRRPVFTFGHFLKALYLPWLRRPLWSPCQRLQISLGDSNLCEEAEYLRVGTTMLVLDVIEAGEMPPVPRVRRPMRALRAIAADPTLRARVALSGGRRWTALEVQRFYLRACQQFLSRRPDAPPEARDVVRRWEDVLDRLEGDPESLVGRLDWVTKRFLLDRCGADAPWAVRKKIDLRYHELSPDGYFRQLCGAGVVHPILSEDEIEAARLDPPPDTPAAERGRQIRAHAATGTLKVTWDGVTTG